jgi:hypothetical protein
MARKIALFVALLATALALGPALAHAFALVNKMGLSRDDYFIAQKAYAGWDRLAYLLLVQFAALVAVVVVSRHDTPALTASLLALACLLGAQAVFWIFTYPANVLTANWTRPSEDWGVLRRQWEYSHAVGAGLQVAALCALLFVAIRGAPQR